MNLYVVIPVVLIVFFYQLGLIKLIYIFISVVGFFYGFLFFDPIVLPYFMKAYKCQISKGLPKIVKTMKETNKAALETHISGAVDLDKALVEVVDLLLKDYVESWYRYITSDQSMLYEMKRSIYKVLSNISTRCHNVDWVSVITEDLPNEIGSHIRLFRLSNQYCRRNKDRDMHDEFFSLESDTDKVLCRQKICTDPTAEKDYLSSISEFILYIITTPEEFDVPALRYFLRETLVNTVLLPLINLLSDPDYINQYIVWLCKDNSYTSEYFIQAIRMSDNREELIAVSERLDWFGNRLRSRDSGGDDDALIKAQIGSLDFVKKVCQSRLKNLDEPINEGQSLLERSISNQTVASITLEFVLEHQIGLSFYLEFLGLIRSQHYLSTYINLVQYQSMYTKLAEPMDDVFYFGDCGLDTNSHESSFTQSRAAEQQQLAEKILNDSKNLKLTETTLVTAEERLLNGDFTPLVFDGIIKEILEILKEKRHFDAFKKSTYFRQFLEEIDFQCDDSLISEDDIIDNSQISSNLDSASTSSISTFGDSDVYTVRIVEFDITKNNYVIYTLVTIKTDKFGNKDTWKCYRRYSDFHSLHNAILDVCGQIADIRLPPKKPFNNLTSEFLEKRGIELQAYISLCLEPKLDQTHPGVRHLAIQFIQAQSLDGKPPLNRMKSIVNPLKTVGNAVLSMPDNFVGNLNRFYSSISPSKKLINPRTNVSHILNGDQVDSVKFGNDPDQGKSESIPIRILFLLVDEIFDLQNKSQVVRKGIFGILRKIVKTFFGLKVNKIILDKAAKFTSSDQVAEFVSKFKEYMWPNGKLAGSQAPRDQMTKMRTKVLCKTKMLGSVSDEVSQYLGNETTRQGVQRVFDLCQDEILNRRLTHCLLQVILQKIFSGHNLDLLLQHKLCPALCGKACDKHNLAAPEWRDWGSQ